jgi:hypothetical protein
MKTRIPLMIASSVAIAFVTLATAGPTGALALFTSATCTRDEVKTLRDQVGCVDAQMPAASPERHSFDELAAHYLAEVDAGRMEENDARLQINSALRSQTASAPTTTQAASAPAPQDDAPLPKGYRRVVKDGDERFCRNDRSDSHGAQRVEICLTRREFQAELAGDSSAANRARQEAGEIIYGSTTNRSGTDK